MQASAYHHGPELIEPWLPFLRDDSGNRDLGTPAGRMAAGFDLLLAIHSLPSDEETARKIVKRLPNLVQNNWKFAESATAAAAFRKSTRQILDELPIPNAVLEEFSYAPMPKSTSSKAKPRQRRQAA
jgi:hypothetical protein